MRRTLVLLAAALAGCATPAADLAEGEDRLSVVEATTPSLLAEYRECTAHNVFLQTEAAKLAPYVPSNWTFTSLAPPAAILRIFHATCADERALLVLSTPMFPDEASAAHHDNPDVVIDVFTNDAEALPHWASLGAEAKLAEFRTAPFLPTGVGSLIVTVDDVLALGLDAALANPVPGAGYEWRAVYAAGTEDVQWYWGDEISPATVRGQYVVHLGPASRIADADAAAAANGAMWPAVDLVYTHGLPSVEE